MLDSSYQGVKRLFVLANDNTAGNNQVSVDSFLPRVKIETYNIKIDVRNFYDKPINDSIKNTTKSEKYQQGGVANKNRGCLLDFSCFEKNYRLIAPDLSKQKALDADSRAIQQFIFKGKIKSTVANTSVRIYYVLEQSKRNNPTIL